MEWFAALVDLFLHLDKHLTVLSVQYGGWIYAILFCVVFAGLNPKVPSSVRKAFSVETEAQAWEQNRSLEIPARKRQS